MLLVPCFTYSNDLNARIENCSNKIHYIKVTHLLFAVLCVQCSPPFADLLRAAECCCSVRNQGAVHYPSLSSVKQSNGVKINPIIIKQYNELMTPTRVIIKAYEHYTDIFNWI